LERVEIDVERISTSEHSMDLKKYMEKRLPLYYPNKGLEYMVKKGAKIEVYHEQFDLNAFLEKTKGRTVEVVIDQYGSTHQRDYCYVVLGHRFQGRQIVQFRGILGENRLYKILLLLRLAGIPKKQITLFDYNPDYREIIAHDLESLDNSFDYIVIGGNVIIKPFLSANFTSVTSAHGEIVSYATFQYSNKKILFTSYPYGDLCEYVVEELGPKTRKAIMFVGSTGALDTSFSWGNIVLPSAVYNDTGSLITQNFPNKLIEQGKDGIKVSNKHLSVKTPVLETLDFIRALKNQGYDTLDVEVAYFQSGCEQHLPSYAQVGIILFVSDQPGLPSDFSKHDYSSTNILVIRQYLAQVVEEEIGGN